MTFCSRWNTLATRCLLQLIFCAGFVRHRRATSLYCMAASKRGIARLAFPQSWGWKMKDIRTYEYSWHLMTSQLRIFPIHDGKGCACRGCARSKLTKRKRSDSRRQSKVLERVARLRALNDTTWCTWICVCFHAIARWSNTSETFKRFSALGQLWLRLQPQNNEHHCIILTAHIRINIYLYMIYAYKWSENIIYIYMLYMYIML